jgi:site-specific DNA recombinase
MIPAYAYARYSSDNQNETSIESQLAEIQRFAAAHDYEIVETFIDRERSAAAVKQQRDEFLRMIHSIRSGASIRAVIVWNLSRYFRRALAAMQFEEEMRSLHINLISVMQPLQEEGGKPSADGLFMRRIQYLFDEKSSHDNSKHTMRNLLQHARSHQSHLGGRPPYGYKVVLSDPSNFNSRRTLLPDPDEAKNVAYIFQSVREGKTYSQTAAELVRRDAVTRNGRAFTPQSLNGILSNPKYAGIYAYGRYNYNRITTGVKEKNDDPVWIEDGCPAIVERGVWEDVQKTLKGRHRVYNSASEEKHVYLLSGLLRCGECARAVIAESKGKGRTPVYRCNTKSKTDAHKWQLGTFGVERAVTGMVWRRLFDGIHAKDVQKALLEEQKGIASERMSRIKSASEDLDRCLQRIDTLVRSVADGMPVHLIKSEIEKLDEEKTFLTGMIQTLRNGDDRAVPSLQDIEALMEERRRAFEENDALALRAILHACIDHIQIWPPAGEEPEKMLIHWTDGTSTEISRFRLSSEENALLGRKAFMKSKGLSLPEKNSDGSVIGGGGASIEAVTT